MQPLDPSILSFLKDLQANNDRDWFHAHKGQYQEAHAQFKLFGQSIMDAMQAHDSIQDIEFWRIYRDVRFSKDKTPYNTHLSFGLVRSKPQLRGGYYFRLKPGETSLAGGFWGPNKEDMKRIRTEIDHNAFDIRRSLNDSTLSKYFPTLEGEQLKTAPQGYAKDHEHIDLLRYKQFLLTKSFSDEETMLPDFGQRIIDHFLAMRPFFDVMTEILTTDENGESIL